MIIKLEKTTKTTLNFFDLLGKDEDALSKAFAFVLTSDPKAYSEFMKYLGFSYLREKSHFPSVQIEIQKKRKEAFLFCSINPKYFGIDSYVQFHVNFCGMSNYVEKKR